MTKLRVAATTTCLLFCLLIIGLWVRSYTTRDTVWWPGTNRGSEISSLSGHAILIIMTRETFGGGFPPFATHHEKIDPNRTLTFGDNVIGFLYRPEPTLVRMDVPFWFLLSICIITAAIAWPRGKWRFSVRGLLIATTILAAALGFAVWAV